MIVVANIIRWKSWAFIAKTGPFMKY
jgi:hypothetical protein